MNNEEKVNFRKNNIGFIFQNNQLLEDFVVEENVALPMILAGHSYKKINKKSQRIFRNTWNCGKTKFQTWTLIGR